MKYPGEGYYYILCDVCGKKMRARDAIFVTDKDNLQNRLLVCRQDADEANPQQRLRSRRDRDIRTPHLIRSEGTDTFGYIHTASEIETGSLSDPTGTSPDAPENLVAKTLSSTQIELTWDFRGYPGTSPVSGYKIERESPVSGGFTTLVANTGYPSTYYVDTGLTTGTQYNYRVSAINATGTSSASNEAADTTT